MREPEREARRVLDEFREAILDMLTLPTQPRHRVMMAFLTRLAWIPLRQLPAGSLRTAFNRIRDRILSAASADAPSMEAYGEAFQRLSDDDVTWIIEQVHTMAIALALHVGAREQRAGRAHIQPAAYARIEGWIAGHSAARPGLA